MTQNKKKTHGDMGVWYFVDILLASILFGIWHQNLYAGLFIWIVGFIVAYFINEVD
jgi:hypothetical protein